MRIFLGIVLFFVSVTVTAQVNQLDANGKRDGVWKKNYKETNQLRYQGTFSHGKPIGVFKFYNLVDQKSVLSAVKTFNSTDSTAVVEFYNTSGKLISKGTMNGKLYIGEWHYYHRNSDIIMTIENYNNSGKLHGIKKIFYPNGQLTEEAHFQNGMQIGVAKNYSENGVLIKEFTYDNNQLHGLSKSYDSNGQLLAEGHYKRDKKNGVWKFYVNGKLKKTKDFTLRSKNPYLKKK